MILKKQLAFQVVVMVVAGGALASAQTVKPTAAKKAHVFFVEPKNNATVTSPLHLKFGSEGIEIAPVPQGDVKTARPGIAHYHLGIDQRCLPAGKTIVKGTPSWVHFGDGKSEFETQLTPGKHRLALQLGDALHNTMPGTCTMMTVTVKP